MSKDLAYTFVRMYIQCVLERKSDFPEEDIAFLKEMWHRFFVKAKVDETFSNSDTKHDKEEHRNSTELDGSVSTFL